MSIESLEELLKKQMPPASQPNPSRTNYVELFEEATKPGAGRMSPEVDSMLGKIIEEDARKAQAARAADPRTKLESTKPKVSLGNDNIDVSGTLRPFPEPAPVPQSAPVPQTAPSNQTNEFLESLKQLNTANSAPQAPSAEYDEVKRQIQEFKGSRDQGGGIHWAEILGMAIPVALGAGVGQVGAPAKSSGKYGIDRAAEERKREQDFNKMLTELQGKLALAQGRQAARNPSDPIKTFEGPDGKPYLLKVSQGQALGLPEFKEGSFAPLETAEGFAAFNKKAGTAGPPFAQAPAKSKDRDFETNIKLATRDKLNQDSDFKTQKTRISATSDAINILNMRNPIGDAGVTTIFAKGIFGDVGNITQEERAAFAGNPMLQQTFKRLYDKYLITGTLEETDRDDLTSLAVGMRDHALKRSREIADNYIKSTGAVGIDPSRVINPLLNQTLVHPQAAPKVEKKKSPASKAAKPVSKMTDKEVEEYLKARGEL